MQRLANKRGIFELLLLGKIRDHLRGEVIELLGSGVRFPGHARQAV
jgi:hypothetical protein